MNTETRPKDLPTWTTGKVKVLCQGNREMEVDAEIFGNLAITPHINHGFVISKELFTLTHTPTGVSVCGYGWADLKKLRQAVQKIYLLSDWNQKDVKKYMGDTELKKAVVNVINKLGLMA